MEENKALAIVDNKVVEDFIFSTGTILNPQQKKLFMALATHNQLDPFKREIHAIPYKDKEGKPTLSVVTGYEVYLKRAERSGKLDGWKVWTEGQGDALKAIVEIRRKDWKEPLKHEVMFKEYNLGRSLWVSKPVTMIKKVAIAQGFRLAFPEELGGIPYTADEIDTDPIRTDRKIEEAQVEETPMEDVEKPTPLGYEDYYNRMSEISNPHELKNWWSKHYKEMEKSLPQDQFAEIVTYKDFLKNKFAEEKK
jgi:phage recombination protein Bet